MIESYLFLAALCIWIAVLCVHIRKMKVEIKSLNSRIVKNKNGRILYINKLIEDIEKNFDELSIRIQRLERKFK